MVDWCLEEEYRASLCFLDSKVPCFSGLFGLVHPKCKYNFLFLMLGGCRGGIKVLFENRVMACGFCKMGGFLFRVLK